MRVTTKKIVYTFAGCLLLVGLLAASVRAQTTLSTNITVGDATHVAGTLSKGSGTFAIDHPLDPKNKILYHSFLESPDVKNVYDGVVTLNKDGSVEIMLPEYFLALNKDFRYLATSIGETMPNLHVQKEVESKTFWFGLIERPVFVIAGGESGGKISWQVTGIRKDVFITERPIITEVQKSPDQLVDVGDCLYEPLCDN